MKVAFVYFSSTGITPKYAFEISAGLLSELSCTLHFHRLKQGTKLDLSHYDLVGIGAPSYSLRAPRLATKLIRKIDFQKKPFFVFGTYNTMIGNTLWNIYKAAKDSAGICLGYIQQGVAVNIRAWKPKINSGKSLKGFTPDMIENARKFGKDLALKFKDLKQDPNQVMERKPRKKFGLRLWALIFTWNWQMMLTVGFKRIDKNKCSQCGLCTKVICPNNAITLGTNGFPKIMERKCVGCNGCVNLCPEDAIWSYKTRGKIPYDLYKEYILLEKQLSKKLNA